MRQSGSPAQLTWGAVDFGRRELTVYSETSKGRRDRTLPISDSLVVLLLAWQRTSSQVEPSDRVLPWEKKTYRTFYNDWKRIIVAAGNARLGGNMLYRLLYHRVSFRGSF